MMKCPICGSDSKIPENRGEYIQRVVNEIFKSWYPDGVVIDWFATPTMWCKFNVEVIDSKAFFKLAKLENCDILISPEKVDDEQLVEVEITFKCDDEDEE